MSKGRIRPVCFLIRPSRVGAAPVHVRKQVETLRARHPDRVRNGLLYLSRPDMQFDVGCAGVALCEGYRLTGDDKYLEAAQRAGKWAQQIPLSANWNYNAFSVWLLSSLYRITEQQSYLGRRDTEMQTRRFAGADGERALDRSTQRQAVVPLHHGSRAERFILKSPVRTSVRLNNP